MVEMEIIHSLKFINLFFVVLIDLFITVGFNGLSLKIGPIGQPNT